MPSKNPPSARTGAGSTFRASDPQAAMNNFKRALSDVVKVSKSDVDAAMAKDAAERKAARVATTVKKKN